MEKKKSDVTDVSHLKFASSIHIHGQTYAIEVGPQNVHISVIKNMEPGRRLLLDRTLMRLNVRRLLVLYELTVLNRSLHGRVSFDQK